MSAVAQQNPVRMWTHDAKKTLDWFFAQSAPIPFSGCWVWTHDISPRGYGKVRFRGRNEFVHRVTYTMQHGPIPDGLRLDHLCRVHGCINPAHLEPVTQAENVRRGLAGKREAARTHCPAGHAYEGWNVIPRENGAGRGCRACSYRRRDERRERLRTLKRAGKFQGKVT